MQYPITCRLHVPPALMEKAFGRGFTANRNGKYTMKEWDFMDSNFDRYLVYDYKATTAYWGENMEPEEYEVLCRNARESERTSQRDSGLSLTLLRRSSGLKVRRPTNLQSTALSTLNGESSESGSTKRWKRPRRTL